MFPDNPFLQLTLARALTLLGRLPATFWTETAAIPCCYAGSVARPIPFADACRQTFEPVKLPFHWGRLFDQGWFRLDLPSVEGDGPLYLHWNDQGEGTAYIDGVPFYGFDVAHRYCALPPGTREVFIESLCLQSGMWHPDATGLDPDGSRLSTARLVRRNDLAWEVYHDLRALYDLAIEECKAAQPGHPPMTGGSGYHPPLDVIPVLCRRLLRALDDAVNAHDQGGPAACKAVLAAAYKTFEGQHERVRASLTGHAHIDLVWLWPERSAEYKAVHTFSTMNRLMDLYPEMRFSYSQTASYDAVGRISPPLLEAVRGRIGEGKWEAAGAMEVESDTLMACGEALARSFRLGQAGFAKLQGRPSRVCWLPDVFGYCGCLPQIMRQSGVDFFFTTKLTWSNINLFPYSSFVWRGTDGTEVLVHVTQDNGYNQVAGPEELRRGARAYRQSDVHDEFLAPTGYGDGGGGVTEEMCEQARRYRSIAGMPEVGWTRLEDFFTRLDAVRPKLPAYQGELYLEYHRGVLTSHGDLKAAFRGAERALQTWEAVRCATGGGEIDEHPWKRVVFAQFHDYIPGTSIWEVYEESVPELQAIAADALATAARELGTGGAPGLFNPLPVERTVLVRDDQGQAVRAVSLGPLQGAPLDDLPALANPTPFVAGAGRIVGEGIEAEFDERGQIARLAFGGQEIPLRSRIGRAGPVSRRAARFRGVGHRPPDAQPRPPRGSPAECIPRRAVRWRERWSPFAASWGARARSLIRYRLDAFEPVLHVEYEVRLARGADAAQGPVSHGVRGAERAVRRAVRQRVARAAGGIAASTRRASRVRAAGGPWSATTAAAAWASSRKPNTAGAAGTGRWGCRCCARRR